MDPIRSSEDDGLSLQSFLEGREVLYAIPSHESSDAALQHTMDRLSAVLRINPVVLKIVLTKLAADYMTERTGRDFVELMNATDILYDILHKIVSFNAGEEQMTKDVTNTFNEEREKTALEPGHKVESEESNVISVEEQLALIERFREEDDALRKMFKLPALT